MKTAAAEDGCCPLEMAAAATDKAPEIRPAMLLPTLQRNALRKIFDRSEFTPEEVAALGYRRLKLADGIGEKGIRTIVAWLADYGYELAPVPSAPRRSSRRSGGGWTLQSAMRLLRIHGYEISAPAGDTPESLPVKGKRSRG